VPHFEGLVVSTIPWEAHAAQPTVFCARGIETLAQCVCLLHCERISVYESMGLVGGSPATNSQRLDRIPAASAKSRPASTSSREVFRRSRSRGGLF
jgi:hypothetical protein